MGEPDTVPATTTKTVPEVREKAREVVDKAAEAAAQTPAIQEAMGDAAAAAAAAAKAATTGDPEKAAEAVQKAADAAAKVMSPEAQSKAADAVAAAQAAAAEPTPAAVTEAAAKAAEAAEAAVADATKAATELAAQVPEVPLTETMDPEATRLAQAMTDDIRAKGCWREDRRKVRAFQKHVEPAAGAVDGLYGPRTALAAATHVPRVPPPCYWPSRASARATAEADWQRAVTEQGINVGASWLSAL